MTPQNLTFPEALREYLEEDTIQEQPRGRVLDEQPWTAPAWLKRLGRACNYTLLALAILGALWIAAQIFVAFHSGRVRQILSQPHPQMRVASMEIR